VKLLALSALLLACGSSPPPPRQTLQEAVNLSRDACKRLLDVTDASLITPYGEGGAAAEPN
jgi:hypothetical protein